MKEKEREQGLDVRVNFLDELARRECGYLLFRT